MDGKYRLSWRSRFPRAIRDDIVAVVVVEIRVIVLGGERRCGKGDDWAAG